MRRISFDNFLILVTSAGIGFDWLPSYIIPGGEKYSLNKIIVTPLILISIAINYKEYLSFLLKFKRALLILFLAINISLAVIVYKTISVNLAFTMISSMLIFIFFIRVRAYLNIKKVIVILCLSAITLFVLIILADFGSVPSISEVQVVTGIDLYIERTYAGVPSSYIGGYISIILGLAWIYGKKFNSWLIIYFISLVACTIISVITGQRSILILVIANIFANIYLFFKYKANNFFQIIKSTKKTNSIILIVILCILVNIFILPYIKYRLYTLSYRIASLKGHDISAISRYENWKYFIKDLVKNPTIIPRGDELIIDKTNVGPHSIFVESYYYGGLLMLIIIVVISFVSIRAVSNHMKKLDNANDQSIMISLLISCLLLIINSLIMPSLFTRIPYVIFGISYGLSLNYKDRSKGKLYFNKLIVKDKA